MPGRPVRCLFFDLDGTLTDPQLGITACIAHALREPGERPPPAAALTRYIGPPLLRSLAELLGSQARAQTALALYRERFARVGIYENRLYPGVPELLAALHGSARLFVVTSKPTVYALPILRHFDLAQYFERIYGSELDGLHSDKVALLAHVLEREAIDPAAAIMIGDRHYDVRGARANALACLGALWGYGSAEELRQAGAGELCETPAALLPVLRARLYNTP